MFAFAIKKAFFDFWDNLISVALYNIGFIALLALFAFLQEGVGGIAAGLEILVAIVGIVAAFGYAGAVSLAMRDIADYNAPTFREFLGYLRQAFPASAALAVIFIFQFLVLFTGIPVYAGMQNAIGFGAIAILFWASIVWWLAAQYYFPVRARLNTGIRAILKKSFLLFFDNGAFSVGLAIVGLIAAGISLPLALLAPGIGGVMLWYQSACKLRLLKYDYLEENPDADRRRIPWTALLLEEQERVGKRTLRGMIFPWKE